MSMIKCHFLFVVMFSTLSGSLAYSSEAVIGPSSGFVTGPSVNDDTGLTLNNLKASYNLKTKEGDDSDIQKQVYSLDALDGKRSCIYDEKITKALNLEAGFGRLDLMQTTVTMLDNPERAKPILNAEQSESVNMTTASETLGAAQLTANESEAQLKTNTYLKNCEKLNKDSINKSTANKGSQNQLNYYSCTIYQIMSHLSALYADSDTLYQKATELETIVNKALEEQTTRNAGIALQENKIKQVNKELTTALSNLKKAKADLKKSEADLVAAKASLEAANKIPCEKKEAESGAESGTESEDCSARDAAVTAAMAAQAKAQSAVDKAKKDVEKTTIALMDLLKNKMNFETRGILALLSGTIYGDANGQDVHFKVNEKEFTLVDTDKALSSMFGLQGMEPHWGRFQLENPKGSQADYHDQIVKHSVDQWFSTAASHLNESKETDKKYYMLNLGEVSRESAHSVGARPAENEKVTADILDKFYNMGNGADNIETIAKALADYQANDGSKQMANLQAMKTPSSRFKYNADALDKTNQLNQNIRAMIINNICYLDSMLSLFRKTHDALKDEAAKNPNKKLIQDPLIDYIYKMSTAPYKQRLEEGYRSKINVDLFLKEFEKNIAVDTGVPTGVSGVKESHE